MNSPANLPNTLRNRCQDGLRSGGILRALYELENFPLCQGGSARLIDDLGLRCYSTHNTFRFRSRPGDAMSRAIELNQIIGSSNLILAIAGRSRPGWLE